MLDWWNGTSDNTNVFFENYNKSIDWYNGFSNPVHAGQARFYRNGVPYNWSSDKKVIRNCNSSWVDNGTVIVGNLKNDLGAQIKLDKVPLSIYCIH
jgi:hypothetical protein